ncbi:MAG: hypothetical protein SOT08_00680 [Candidatus Borkfalkiaceae bacterium]|nr:hypothetical protein [Christensenellaceae bacterium]
MSSLLPAFSPAITSVVFLETEPAVSPPRLSIISAASSRLKSFNVPVRATFSP